MTANNMFITEERYNSSIYVVTRQQDSNKDTIIYPEGNGVSLLQNKSAKRMTREMRTFE